MNMNLSKYARFVIDYSVEVEKGDTALILASSESIPLIKELYRELIKAGAHPLRPYIEFPEQEYIFFKEAKDFQLDFKDPMEIYAMQNIDVLIMVQGKMNTRELSNIPPKKLQQKKMTESEMMGIFYKRAAVGELKWTMIPYPSNAMAQDANMSQEELAEFTTKACFLDKSDPIAIWNELHDKQQIYCDFLNNVDEIRFISKDTNLRMSVKGRRWINSDGKGNLPDGEIYTGPVEDSVNGHVKFSYPAVDRSHIIEGIQLTFKDGLVVDSNASKGKEVLNSILEIPGARRVGEIAIGTNYALDTFVGNILFDEKLGGTFHLALGSGYPETGSKNESSTHKDLLCDMKSGGKIFVDGKLIYENGKFLISSAINKN